MSMSATPIRAIRRVVIVCLAGVFLGCAAAGNSTPGTRQGAEPTVAQPRLREATLSVGTVRIVAELAVSDEQKARGLMFRQALEDGHGMLFVWDRDRRMSFWMKNTVIPLSIAFIASDGTIRQIRDMIPRSLDAVQSELSCRYALEVPQGWFARAGIAAGDRLSIPQDAIDR